MKKKQIKSKDIAQDLKEYNYTLSKKDIVELYNDTVIVINKQPLFFYYNNNILPTLKFLMKSESSTLKQVTVDMGAVKFVTNGADIMRPGITNIDEGFKVNDPVVIVDQTHKKLLAIGIALYDSNAMQKATTGKVIKNIHYVGDEIWKML